MEKQEVYKLREHYRQVHSSIGLYIPHRSIWVWISLYRLLPLPWKVPIVPHCHVSSRVTLLTVLLSIWGFHFLSIQTTGKCNPAVEIRPHKNNTEMILQHFFFFFL